MGVNLIAIWFLFLLLLLQCFPNEVQMVRTYILFFATVEHEIILLQESTEHLEHPSVPMDASAPSEFSHSCSLQHAQVLSSCCLRIEINQINMSLTRRK